jgi:hypothetical protein
MAGPARYSALVDACALHPFAVADALMSVYRGGLCMIKWTRHIEEEWLRSVTRNRPELGERLPRRRDMMRLAVTDWEVPAQACEPLMPALHRSLGLHLVTVWSRFRTKPVMPHVPQVLVFACTSSQAASQQRPCPVDCQCAGPLSLPCRPCAARLDGWAGGRAGNE